MRDFDRYSKEFYISTKNARLSDVLTHYELPNDEELHSMICGYKNAGKFDDTLFFDAESIDYFKYEKELWRLERPKR